jgi:hypothetical protein
MFRHLSRGVSLAALAAFACLTMPAPVQADDRFIVTGIENVGEKRISRTVFEYSYRVSVRNDSSEEGADVVATLVAVPSGTTIVDGRVACGNMLPQGTAAPGRDLIVIRQDRTVPFDPAGLKWSFSSATLVKLEPVKPADLVVLAAADLGLPASGATVTTSGAIREALLRDGTLRFATPGDSGSEQHGRIVVRGDSVNTVLDVTVRTMRPTAPVSYEEPDENGNPPAAAPVLEVIGFWLTATTGGDIAFRLADSAGLDLADDSIGTATGRNGARIALHDYWTFDRATATFSISGAAREQLLAALPGGPLALSLNFVSKDGMFTASYDLLAAHRGVLLQGRILHSDGRPVTSLLDRTMLLAGYNTGHRVVTPITYRGEFDFANVIPDTYQLTLVELDNPGVTSVSTAIYDTTTEATVTIVYPVPGQGATHGEARRPESYAASSVIQDGAPPPRQAVRGRKQPPALAAGRGTVFSAVAGAQDETVSVPVSFAVPQGTQGVNVQVSVFTEEYPYYTSQHSEYNDTWSYSVTGLPGVSLVANGSVNDSHYLQPTITRSQCVDVSQQATAGALTVGGIVSATNIGDGELPTTSTVELTLGCTDLQVSSARFMSPNASGNPVLEPIHVSDSSNEIVNIPGPYLSLQATAADGTHTLPLEIRYTPANATITEVQVGVSTDPLLPRLSSVNLLDQPHVKSPGKISFPSLSLPPFPGVTTTGKVTATVRLRGIVDGSEKESLPRKGGQLTFEGKSSFIPLYLAGAVAPLDTRRYNAPHDAGGDSWATRHTIDWLLGRPYRFDDISGMHVAQTAGGRSILGHAGHSDGQQVDMRYADGQGGYTDELGGQDNGSHIQALITAAAQEVAGNAPQKPKLAALQAWIKANRAMLEADAITGFTRKIYIGNAFIKLALIDGKFNAGAMSAIPGITAWARPYNVFSVNGHLHHWHISVSLHP